MPKFLHSVLKDVEMDDEFKELIEKHKEKQLTPLQMDLKIQADRVIYVINRALAKLNVMAHLPLALDNNCELLRKYLKSSEVTFILDALNDYGTNFDNDTSGKDMEDYTQMMDAISAMRVQSTKLKRKSLSGTLVEAVSDPQIHQIIDLIFYNKCLHGKLSQKNEKSDKNLLKFIGVMNELKNIAKMTLYVTGDEQTAMEKELRRAYKSNVLLTASIDELKEHLEKQRKELGHQLNKKVEVFEKYNKKMEDIKENFQFQMKKTLHESEKIMMHKSLESEQEQAVLAEEARKVTQKYETLLEDHLAQEKQTRAKRFKIETQLQNWLSKYDQDIGERQAEYEALKKEYDDEKEAMEDLEDKFDEQEREYVVLMQEKAEEEERVYNEMAYQFLLNRSARMIQRFWREYRERRKRRGKRGKGKGGKKGGKGKKAAPAKTEPRSTRTEDPNALLETSKKFKSDVFDELKDPNAFDQKEVKLDL